MEKNTYSLKLQFGTNLSRTGTMSIPKANPSITDAQTTVLMQKLIDIGIVRLTHGNIISKESAALVTTVFKNFAV